MDILDQLRPFSGAGESAVIRSMYLRHTTIRKNGKVHRYWRLVRSVRVGRRVNQQTVAHLGELDEVGAGPIQSWAASRNPCSRRCVGVR